MAMATSPQTDSLQNLTHRAIAILLAVAFANGIAAGVQWHELIAGWFHLEGYLAVRAFSPTAGENQIWICEVHPGAPPEKGPGSCSICGRALMRAIAYWWDPSMNPPFVSDHPGTSPIGVELVPVFEDQLAPPATSSQGPNAASQHQRP